jgi:microcystin-dependent protein
MTFHKVKDRIETLLDGALNDTAEELDVVDASVFPATPFYITIDDERLEVTDVSDDTLTVVRGVLDSVASEHLDQAKVFLNVVSGHITELQNEVSLVTSPLPGDIKWTCRQSADDGYLICNGDAVSRITYAALFSVIGVLFGIGDGATTFNLPDFRGRFPIAQTGVSEDEFEAMGTEGGDKEHQLTEEELAGHTHTYIAGNVGFSSAQIMYQTGPTPASFVTAVNPGTLSDTGSTGGDEEHATLPPYLVISTAQIKY